MSPLSGQKWTNLRFQQRSQGRLGGLDGDRAADLALRQHNLKRDNQIFRTIVKLAAVVHEHLVALNGAIDEEDICGCQALLDLFGIAREQLRDGEAVLLRERLPDAKELLLIEFALLGVQRCNGNGVLAVVDAKVVLDGNLQSSTRRTRELSSVANRQQHGD